MLELQREEAGTYTLFVIDTRCFGGTLPKGSSGMSVCPGLEIKDLEEILDYVRQVLDTSPPQIPGL